MSSRRSQLGFVALFAISVLVAWRPLVATFSLASRDEQYTHILLILPFAIVLAWTQLAGGKMDWRPARWAFGVLALAAILGGLAAWAMPHLTPDVRLAVSMIALVLWWIGAFVLCFGAEIAGRVIFPLCFLFWLVPFPQFLLNAVVSALQLGSAFSAKILFLTVGVPVMHNGVQLSIPGLTLEVATECSSIRSSMILLVTTMVVGELVLRSTWRKTLLVVVAIPLCVAKNGLRIFTIAMLGTRVDPAYLTGRLHREGGPIFLGIALGIILLLLWVLRRTERPPNKIGPTLLPGPARA